MKQIKSDILVYQTKSGAIELKGDVEHETIWANQTQIVELFEVDQSVVSRHLKNIFRDGEVKKESNMQKLHIPSSDKPISLYSLDVILAVGYRTNSARAITFRQWATKTLRQHIIHGFTINKSRVKHNYEIFLNAVDDVKALLPAAFSESSAIIELIKTFARTWVSLDAYDKSALPESGITKQEIDINGEMIANDIQVLKRQLLEKDLASDLFAVERNPQSVESIFANVFQSFGGQDVYPTIEEKAAHLLYFMVKNHPYIDGNKRSAAFSFVWFLKKANKLNPNQLSPEALTAITLLIAESQPVNKDKMIGLILLLLNQNSS